jgi:outer membrane beta-barrel protein/carboxypeptidase family protein
MSRRAALFAGLLLMLPSPSHAQVATPVQAQITSLRGRFQDPTTQAAVPGVQVKLTNMADTTDVRKATGKDDGTFEITGLGVHSYRLEASRLGFTPLKTIIRVTKKDQDAGVLALATESIPMGGITVSESPPPATQKADTTEYRAGAVKTHKDATAEDLVQKLPGITIEGGQVKAQGENVQQVLVNGRPFFGSDPTAAMRNLPADVVDRIQVYDRQSDQAEFSGFEDGQQQRTMNFILRDQKMQFGKAYAGGGDQDRYQAGGNATVVRGANRLTAIGMSNNVNQKNFSPQDLFGAMSGGGGGGGPRIMMMGGGGGGPRGPGGGGGQFVFRGGGGFGGGGQFDPSSFLVGQQQGISTTHSGGLNYAGQWGTKLAVTSSLFANDSDTDNLQTLTRQYLPPQDSLAFYDQSNVTDSRNRNQRFDARFEWTLDSLNSVVWQPRLYFQQTDATNTGDAANTTASGTPVSAASSATTESNDGNNLSSRLTLRHRFAKKGRNVSAEINLGHNLRDGASAQRSLTEHYDGPTTTTSTLDQRSTAHTTTNSFSTRVAFTEPLNPRFRLQAIYHPSLTRSDSDPRGFQLDTLTGEYTRLDSTLSNSYLNRNTVQNGGLALLYTRGGWRLLSNASYQQTRLRSEQIFPLTQTIERTFDDFVPSVTLTGAFANRRNVRLAWNTSTNAPSISQLQNVVNNANPLSLSTGNPDLRTAYNQTLSLRLSEADPAKSRSKFVFLNVTRTSHPIGNSTFTAPTDTTLDGVFLARGTQLTKPVNLDASWNANVFGVYSRPLTKLKSILSLNGGGTLTRTPSLINNVSNLGRTYAIRSGVVLSSNISQNLDFTVSYWSTYNISRSTLSTANTGDYFTHNAGLRLNAVVGPGIVLRQEVNHNLQSGVPSAYGQDVVLMNSTIGKKFLKDGRGELRLTATDVLQENRAVSRNVTETYVQDSRDRTLGRYVQMVFTYTFRSGTTPGMGMPGMPGMPGRP